MKPEQLQSQLSRVLGEAIAALRDPRVPMIVTIERVAVTSDYGMARVYVSSMTGNMDDLVDALNNARGHLQRQVSEQVRLRRTPTLEFFDAGGKVW